MLPDIVATLVFELLNVRSPELLVETKGVRLNEGSTIVLFKSDKAKSDKDSHEFSIVYTLTIPESEFPFASFLGTPTATIVPSAERLTAHPLLSLGAAPLIIPPR